MRKSIFSFVTVICIAYTGVAHSKCNKEQEINALALNMYHEARGEGSNEKEERQAMQMVGEVVINRVESVNYPDTICEVIYQKNQFSWTTKKNTKPKEQESWHLAKDIAEDIVEGNVNRIANGATNFVNPRAVGKMPAWTKKFKKVAAMGNHVFYSDRSKRIYIKINRGI